jgi:thiol-disulfide isomerase/thioredoxin
MTCREVLPIVNGLKKEYGDRISFVRVNIHKPESRPLMEKYGFTSTPELYLVEDGKVIGAWDDLVTTAELRQAFNKALNQ